MGYKSVFLLNPSPPPPKQKSRLRSRSRFSINNSLTAVVQRFPFSSQLFAKRAGNTHFCCLALGPEQSLVLHCCVHVFLILSPISLRWVFSVGSISVRRRLSGAYCNRGASRFTPLEISAPWTLSRSRQNRGCPQAARRAAEEAVGLLFVRGPGVCFVPCAPLATRVCPL